MGLAGLLQRPEVRKGLKDIKPINDRMKAVETGTPLGVAMSSIMDKPKEVKKKMARQTVDAMTPGGESLLEGTSNKSNTMVGY